MGRACHVHKTPVDNLEHAASNLYIDPTVNRPYKHLGTCLLKTA